MKPKARSRLGALMSAPVMDTKLGEVKIARPKIPATFKIPAWWTQRQPKLMNLIISLVIYGYISYLLTHIFPDDIRNWLIPGSFLPLLSLAALAHWYFWGFVTLNSRRALFIALTLTWLLWLQLHRFEVGWEVVGWSFAVLLSIESGFFLIKKWRQKSHK